jgi:hypothetical protein
MKKTSLYGIVIGALSLAVGFFGCHKTDGVDNNQVLQTPYALFFADTAGALYKTNDGTNYKFLFPADGKPTRAICVSGPNVLWVKDNLYYSQDNGKNFNHSYDSVNKLPMGICSGILPMNQSMIISVTGLSETLVLVSSGDPSLQTSYGLLDAVYSRSVNGRPGLWFALRIDTNGQANPTGPIDATSFTQQANGVLVSYDGRHNRVFYSTANEGFGFFKESTGNDAGLGGRGNPNIQSGNGLPDSAYCIGHINNRLIALINQCTYHGAWYSDDTGRNWTSYPGLPQNQLLCVASPFEKVCLVGTKGAGLYTLNLNTGAFQPNSNGLASDLIVRSIASHQNVYKNGNTEQFIFLATNKGIYTSKDGGINWTKTIPGNYTAVY